MFGLYLRTSMQNLRFVTVGLTVL